MDTPEAARNEMSGTTLGPLVQARDIGALYLHPQAAVPPPGQLPPCPRMVDREPAVAALNAMREASAKAATIALITGSPGMGKTLLALNWAHGLRRQFPGGQLYANLRSDLATGSIVNPETVLGDFLYALGVPPDAIPGDFGRRAALYRSLTQDRPILLVLDDALSAAQVRMLVPACPASVTVVTSRYRLSGLNVDGARAIHLDRLELGPALALLAERIGAERTEREHAAAAHLVELCGHHPLALAIAAALLDARPNWRLADMVAALGGGRQRAASLSIGDDMAVNAALEQTYDALTPEAARLYRLLSLVPGDTFTGALAAALAEIPRENADYLLGVLIEVNLLSDGAGGRYRFHHPFIRAHASQRAERQVVGQVEEAAISRMLGWYLATAARAERAIRRYRDGLVRDAEPAPAEPLGFADERRALEWLETELPNLREAVRLARERGRHPAAWQLADAMWPLFQHRGHHTDRLVIEEIALKSTRALGDRYAEAKMLNRLGQSLHELGRHVEASARFAEAQSLWEELGEHDRQAGSLRRLGWVAAELGDDREAMACFVAAHETYRRLGAGRKAALALIDLAQTLIEAGRGGAALSHLVQARMLLAEADDSYNTARVHTMTGRAHLAAGRPGNAAAELHLALEAMTRLGSATGCAEVLEALGELGERTGDFLTARGRYEQALEVLGEAQSAAHVRIRSRIAALEKEPARRDPSAQEEE